MNSCSVSHVPAHRRFGLERLAPSFMDNPGSITHMLHSFDQQTIS